VDVDAARGEIAAALGDAFPRRTGASATAVLGAGNDDLAPGLAWLRALAPGGWAVPTWPAEHGGRGATVHDAALIARELAAYEQPDLYPYLVGLHVVGPTLLTVASPDQQERWLRRIASGEEIWCQLFSEPGAGSDLANVSTRAERDGDVWRLSGQKVWSSRAHYARWGFCLARTDLDVPKHAGITAFAVDMAADGVDVRPLRQMNGDEHFSEVFLDGVLVADADRIGEIGGGWPVARTALANERGAVGAAGTGLGSPADRLLELARSRSLDRVATDRVAHVHVDAEVARLTARRARDAARAGTPGPEGSGAKLRGSRTLKQTTDAALALLGADALVDEEREEWHTLFLTAPSISIRGGTDEIQRNIVGERVLGLPPEPRVDVDRPYRDVAH
jgi:alkylation response protein AidB-like acyl-CoA dehydrogenase